MPSRRNTFIADKLREAADLLEQQGANPFRVRAYRQAAQTVDRLEEDAKAILQRDGMGGLTALPHIGTAIAAAVNEMVKTDHWSQLDRLRGAVEPEQLFQSIPGVGAKTAHAIHERLGVDTLAALEVAAHDGRLADVPGIGARRAAIIRATLAEMLGRPKPRRPLEQADEPPVDLLLDVDAEYRKQAAADRLPKIAPKRFNPSGEAWLPLLHTERAAWRFTVLFSNTARAHELDRTHDWVVIYFHADDEPEGQRTVVTETRGALASKRVVRGREGDCRDYYEGINRRAG